MRGRHWQIGILATVGVICFFSCISVSRSYKELKEYNYFSAREHFYKQKKKKNKVPAAALGLAIIYMRNDNPFFQIDSAYHYATLADSIYVAISPKRKEKLRKQLSVDSLVIDSVKQAVDYQAFVYYAKMNTLERWNHFLTFQLKNRYYDTAAYIRDKIIYDSLLVIDSSCYWKYFIEHYPNSAWRGAAEKKFHAAYFKERTAHGTKEEYENFIRENPLHPYVEEAYSRLFDLFSRYNYVDSLYAFVKRFPESSWVKEAWRRIMLLSIPRWDERESILAFVKKFPDCTHKDVLREALKAIEQRIISVRKGGKYYLYALRDSGYVGEEMDYISPFQRGVAYVRNKGAEGIINLAGQWLYKTTRFSIEDFSIPYLIVSNGEKSGLVDITGKEILPVIYDELYLPSEGYVVGAFNGKYGYLDTTGAIRIEFKYDNASDFKGGYALVEYNHQYGIIRKNGAWAIFPFYEWIGMENFPLIKVRQEGRMGLCSITGDTLLPCKYAFIEIVDSMIVAGQHDTIFYFPVNRTFFRYPFYSLRYVGDQALSVPRGPFRAMIFFRGGKRGIMDSGGNVILKNDYAEIIFNPSRTMAIVRQKESDPYQLFDMEKRRWKAIRRNFVSWLNDTLFLFQERNRTGISDREGNILLPPEYDAIEVLNSPYVALKKDYAWQVMDLHTGKIREWKYQHYVKQGEYYEFVNEAGEVFLTNKHFQIIWKERQ